MKVIQSEKHRLRNAKTELYGGELVPPFECPERMNHILASLRDRGFATPEEPQDFGIDPILRIHKSDFVSFMAECWRDWQAAGYSGEAIATAWPSRAMPRSVVPREIDGRIGYYCLASETSIAEGTYEAALSSVNVALAGQRLVAGGERTAFALCRPPGHHAATDMFGGYCFFNNAAIAAQAFLDAGAQRVAVLDVDFHHGNGTQEIFYGRDDVLFVSLHGDPLDAFPYYLGGADETGAGRGEGYTLNYPLAPGTGFEAWREALTDGLGKIRAYGPDALVVSLGVDTFKADPISFFKLDTDDFTTYGADIAALELPTLFVMEGGYAIAEIGVNTVNVLEGFLNA